MLLPMMAVSERECRGADDETMTARGGGVFQKRSQEFSVEAVMTHRAILVFGGVLFLS